MTNDKPAIRMKITVVKVGIRQRIEGKPYERLDFIGKTDKSGEKEITFVTFKPDVMDSIYEGNSFPADVVVETSQGKTESVITKVYLPDSRETAETTRTVLMSVSDMICSPEANREIPEDIRANHFELIRKIQKEALK